MLLVVTAVIILSSLFAPAASISLDGCHSCHGMYYQYLDILEGDGGNSLPTTVSVGEIKVVSVAIENSVDSPSYTLLGVFLSR